MSDYADYVTPRRTHVLLNTALASIIGLLIFLIAAMDHPYSGSARVKPEAFRTLVADTSYFSVHECSALAGAPSLRIAR
jgi:hypothetical protein